MDVMVHVAMGIGLAACAGLRAFLPLLIVGLAGRFYDLPLSESFAWLSEWPALVVFGAAVVAELLGDKLPVVDHFLDSIQLFVKPIAGALVTATVVADWSPLYLSILSIVGGGSLAAAVHVTKAQVRLASTATTAGIGNPVLSSAEDIGAAGLSVGAILAPVAIGVIALVGLAVTLWSIRSWRHRRSYSTP